MSSLMTEAIGSGAAPSSRTTISCDSIEAVTVRPASVSTVQPSTGLSTGTRSACPSCQSNTCRYSVLRSSPAFTVIRPQSRALQGLAVVP